MNITVLGCGDAFGSDGRFNTSFLLSKEQEHVLLDCGASTLIRLKQERVNLLDISTIILTHFHGDHYGGVPFFLISSLFEMERKSPLTIVGPPGVKERVFNLMEAMYPGTAEKLSGLDLVFTEYQASTPLALDNKKITAYPVEHSEPSIPHGIRLDWNGKVLAFSGDTSWSDNLVPLSKGADLFICECNFWDQQVFGHLCYHELAEKRDLFNCGNIWLTHMNDQVIAAEDIVFNKLEDGMKLTI